MFKQKKKKVGSNQTKRLSQKGVNNSSSSESNAELSNSGSDSEPGSNEHLPLADSSVGDSDDGKEWGKKVDASL